MTIYNDKSNVVLPCRMFSIIGNYKIPFSKDRR